MGKVFLVVLALAVPGLHLGQVAALAQVPAPAPKLGHPLDPADVDILTGKARVSAPLGYRLAATPYTYFPTSVNAPLLGQTQFAPVSTATQPPFVPLLFGRVGDRRFVVIRTTTAPMLPGLPFVLGASRGSTSLLFAPGFVVWSRSR